MGKTVATDRGRGVSQWRRLLRPGVNLPSALALVAVLVAAGFALNLHLFDQTTPPATARSGMQPGTDAEFAFLAAQHSNFCSLSPGTVMGYTDDMRLQGACCSALDQAKYQWQVAGLRRYSAVPELAQDPYDFPVVQAKALLAYDTTLTLTAVEQTVYDSAMTMTADHGPCCCHCWRWNVTEGLAKFLIAKHSMSAQDVATIVDLTNGCGGPRDAVVGPSAEMPTAPP